MKNLHVSNFGPIIQADIEFGDLTVLVGPQASGKSLFVQLVKALRDGGAIRADLRNYGFDWRHGDDEVADFAELYFGGGLQNIVSDKTGIRVDGKHRAFEAVAKIRKGPVGDETVFLIPAQRVLVLQDGWPKPFMTYSVGDPYAMRRFSETLRIVMDGFASGSTVFPQVKRLKAPLRNSVDASIYVGFKLELETEGMRRRVVLAPETKGAPLPFNAWSAGQREFTPLLLGMYWLMPPSKTSRRGALTEVIIEEPEMGLHPQAIVTFGLLVLELLHRNYRVTVSTHSPVVLDIVWALQSLKGVRKADAIAALRNIFGIEKSSQQIDLLFKSALKINSRVFYFDRIAKGIVVRDISSLDPSDPEPETAGWGGLSGFSGKIADAVGLAATKERGRD